MRRLAALAAVALLSGCATGLPKDPAQTVYFLEGSLTTALNTVAIYTHLPACPASGPCKDKAIEAKIDVYAQSAVDAVLAAEAAVAPGSKDTAAQVHVSIDAATKAVTDLTSATPKTGAGS